MARRSSRSATLFGLAVQLMFVVMASRSGVSLEEFYAWLLVFSSLQAFYFWLPNLRDPTLKFPLDVEAYSFSEAPRQILAGLAAGLLLTAPLLVVGRLRAPDLAELTTQGLFVSFVETVYLVVNANTLFVSLSVRIRGRRIRVENLNVGRYVWPFLFAFMHPAVRLDWLAGNFSLESFAAFLYAFVFGVLFYLLYAARAAEGIGRAAGWFGAVTSWFAHFTINMVIVAFPYSIAGFDFFPLALGGGSAAAAVLAAAVLVPLLLVARPRWRRRWRR